MTKDQNKLTLAELRRRAGLTQLQLANLLSKTFNESVTVGRVSGWETELHKLQLTPERMLALCEILDCTLEELASATKSDDS